ncbi:hypothetical protein E8E11_009739 [Didymella keratinophila]|nr:hypothetical protein E8E11_009739 [Didymella keratinophila]
MASKGDGDGAGHSISEKGFTKAEIMHTGYAMIAFVSVFVLSRLNFQVTRRKKLELQDYLLYFAYLCYLGACGQFLAVVPVYFRMADILAGKVPLPPDFLQIAGLSSRLLWGGQFVFYNGLWSVKLSLLCLYKKLLAGLPTFYIRIWWAMTTFCLLAYIGATMTLISVCNSMSAFFATATCNNSEEQDRAGVALYVAYALDVVTDLLGIIAPAPSSEAPLADPSTVMTLPIRLVWNLQMPRRQKVAICALFASGVLCIAFATIRMAFNGVTETGKPGAAEPKWLAFWSVLEMSIAVIIGCCPAFAALITTRRRTKRESSHGYVKHSGGPSSGKGSVSLKLNTMVSSKSRHASDGTLCGRSHDSQDQLALSPSSITVTTQLYQHESDTALPDKV